MKYVKEFRDPNFVKKMIKKITANTNREIIIMEVCGTHTMSIFRSGIRDLLPSNIKLISGPGCPVCVTSQGYIDSAIELAKNEKVIITTFGDMMKVPGNKSSLQKEKALGRDIRMVLSPLDAVEIARENPHKEVVFLGVGFETTAPTIALSVDIAYSENIKNYSVLQSMKTMPVVMKQLVLDKELKIDGFLCPGHVSAIIGAKPYEFLAKEFGIPAVVTGFEAGDIVIGIYEILLMIENNSSEVKNSYKRVAAYEGNERALKMIKDVMEVSDSNWRGLGRIKGTGLKLKDKYRFFDTEKKLHIKIKETKSLKECLCGEILKGKNNPLDCKLFSKVCNPSNPVGACMVSEEGTCATYYKYQNVK